MFVPPKATNMLTQDQRNTFRLTLAAWNNYGAKTIDDLDIDDVLSDDQIVETRETVENFVDANGQARNKVTFLGNVCIWDNIQARKGAARGTLFVMDFGDARASFFDGEI